MSETCPSVMILQNILDYEIRLTKNIYIIFLCFLLFTLSEIYNRKTLKLY